jgi:hypothetical protein
MIKLTLENEENYAARFVTLEKFENIDGADKIKHTLIKGYRVIVASDTQLGQKGVFFPVETQISKEFLSKNNLFSDKSLNEDKEKVSYSDTKIVYNYTTKFSSSGYIKSKEIILEEIKRLITEMSL